MWRSKADNTVKGKRREGALLAVAALLLALVLLGGPPALAEEGGWDLETGLAAVSLPSALDDFAVAHSDPEAGPSGANADGQREEADAVTDGLPAVGAVTNLRSAEEETEALHSAASTGGDSLASVETCDDSNVGLAAAIEPLVTSPLADQYLDVTSEVTVDHDAVPPAPPPSTSSDGTQQEEPQLPSSLGQQPTSPDACEEAPEPGAEEPAILATPVVGVQESRAALVPESDNGDQPSLLGLVSDRLSDQVEAVPEGANMDQGVGQLATTEEAESPSYLPSAPSHSEEVAAEQVPADEEAEAIGLRSALGHLAANALRESAAAATEVDLNEEEVEMSSLERAEAAEGRDIVDAEGEIGGEVDVDYETEGKAEPDGIAGDDLAECEEAAELASDRPQEESEEGIATVSAGADHPSDEPIKSPPERPNESEARQGEGATPAPNLDEVAEKEQPAASGGELVTPQEEADEEGKVMEEKKRKQESLMARKKRLLEQAGNQTAEEEEQAREVVRRKLESLHQRDQAKQPSPNVTSVPQGHLTKNRTSTHANNGSARAPGGPVRPTAARSAAVVRESAGVKAPARVAGVDAEKLSTLKQAPETRSPAVAVASPSAGTACTAAGKNSPTTSSSPPGVVSPSHPAPGRPKASPTRLDPPSHLAGEARSGQRPSGAGLRGGENTEAEADSPSDEGEDDLDAEDEYEEDWENEDDGLLDDEDDELPALVVDSSPQQKSLLAKDQGAEPEAHTKAGPPNDSSDKARKLAERKILLKMAKEASGISHSVDEDPEMKAWKRRAKLKNMETKRKQDVPVYDIASAATRRRELDRIKKEKLKNKGSLRYKKAV